MNPLKPLTLLAGLSPRQFMQRHWQKKPLLVRAAVPALAPPISRNDLFALAARDDVRSRLVQQVGRQWRLDHGPFSRRSLPALRQTGWTLLVQGVDRHCDEVARLQQQFRFLPDARLDDVMVSYASDRGGVGPHQDSYDVFLLQASGQRRWRIARAKNETLRAGLPLRILANFEAEQEFLLDAGDMLYLPPGYAHDGVAVGECLTCSIGFRAPRRRELGVELLQRMAEAVPESTDDPVYRDPDQAAVSTPALLPAALRQFAESSMRELLQRPHALSRALGEYLTEPQANVWFVPQVLDRDYHRVVLDRKTRMLHDRRHVFVNGESYRASSGDARLMRRLAQQRRLDATELSGLGRSASGWLQQWIEAGWAHGE